MGRVGGSVLRKQLSQKHMPNPTIAPKPHFIVHTTCKNQEQSRRNDKYQQPDTGRKSLCIGKADASDKTAMVVEARRVCTGSGGSRKAESSIFQVHNGEQMATGILPIPAGLAAPVFSAVVPGQCEWGRRRSWDAVCRGFLRDYRAGTPAAATA